MSVILIIESNTPEMIAGGSRPASDFFVRSFADLSPRADVRIAAPYETAFDPALLDEVDGVVFTGSGVAWNTSAPQAKPLQDAMEVVFNAGLSVWGSCNGMQLAATVLGGAVGANGFEAAFARDVRLTQAGKAHPMMRGRVDGFAVPCIHRDEVTRLPEGAVLIASNAHSQVQAMSYETGGVRFWGTQYHPEMTGGDVAQVLRIPGVCQDFTGPLSDIDMADTDTGAASRLGVRADDLRPSTRMTELANWLTHIGAEVAAPKELVTT